ncbi:hypothetical protein FACS1894216_02770 [Synergistales bacterium]|nr:hypothetical protein FACS1894216_02770 [Synergistales bacterium]
MALDWTQIVIVALTVLFGSGGVAVTVIQRGRSHDKEFAALIDEIKQLKEGQGAIKEVLKVNGYATKKQIKYTLTRLHREASERDYVTRYELECAEDLYIEYKRLNGNTFVDRIMEEIRELPIHVPVHGQA